MRIEKLYRFNLRSIVVLSLINTLRRVSVLLPGPPCPERSEGSARCGSSLYGAQRPTLAMN
jgi:hypothetical protein